MSKLDQFFRRKLEGQPQPNFDPAAWAAMEQLLENQVAGAAGSSIGTWVGVALLALAGTAGGVFLWADTDVETTVDANTYATREVSLKSYPTALFTDAQSLGQRSSTSGFLPSAGANHLSAANLTSVVPNASLTTPAQLNVAAIVAPDSFRPVGVVANAASSASTMTNGYHHGMALRNQEHGELLASTNQLIGMKPMSLLYHSALKQASAVPDRVLSKDKASNFFNRRQKHYFSVIAGNTFSQGYINSESDRANLTYSQFAGAGYEYVLNARYSINANLMYTSRSGLNSVREFEAIQYGLGFERERVILSTRSLHYASVPVYLTLQHGAHGFIGGVDMAYLVNAKSDYTRILDDSYGVISADTQTEWGYMKGFNRFDAALIAGYHFGITEELGVGIRARYGLLDVTRDDYFKNEQRDQNVQLQVTLDYKLFGL